MKHIYLKSALQRLQQDFEIDGMSEIVLNRPDKIICYADLSNPEEVALNLMVGNFSMLGFKDTPMITLKELFSHIDLNNYYADVGGKQEYYDSIVHNILDFSNSTNITFPIKTNVRNWVRLTTIHSHKSRDIQAFHFTIVTEYINFEEDVFYKTHHDSLTGLFNKYTLDYHYGARYQFDQFHVLYLDLDDFKKLNDTLGHNEGDKYLQQFGKMLKSYENNHSRFYRIGGDEFVGMFFAPTQNIKKMAQEIIEKTKALTNSIANMTTSVSIGIIEATKREDVIRKADRLMYQAKDAGKNQFLFETEKE